MLHIILDGIRHPQQILARRCANVDRQPRHAIDAADGSGINELISNLPEFADQENAAFRTVLLDRDGTPKVPNGSLGHRWGDQGLGKWNLKLDGIDPLLSMADTRHESVEVLLSRFDVVPDPADEDAQHVGTSGVLSRGVSGIAGRTLIVNFPGNPPALTQLFPIVAPTLAHADQTLSRTGGRAAGA